jgi:uncharacterized membrane protein
MTRDELRKLWETPSNWSSLGRYHCEADPRLIVPKRIRFGWTLNWANPLAWPVLVVVIAAVIGFVFFRRFF